MQEKYITAGREWNMVWKGCFDRTICHGKSQSSARLPRPGLLAEQRTLVAAKPKCWLWCKGGVKPSTTDSPTVKIVTAKDDLKWYRVLPITIGQRLGVVKSVKLSTNMGAYILKAEVPGVNSPFFGIFAKFLAQNVKPIKFALFRESTVAISKIL